MATSIIDDAAAWLGLPAIFALTTLGIGLLVERAAGLRFPPAALIPVGMCTSICALLPLYDLGGHGWLAGLLLLVLAATGFVVGRDGLLNRLRPGPAGAVALVVAGLYAAPTVLTGHWSWNGYNFLNDTSVQFLLADQLEHHGAEAVRDGPSTRSETIRTYLDTAYPLGAHAHLATLSWLLRAGVDVVYQTYLTMVSVTAALSLTVLARRAGLTPWRAAAAAVGALAANLIYQYALQGSIKEVAAFACLAAAAMLGRELLSAARPLRAAVPVALAAAAMLGVFSAAAGPYLLVLAGGLAVGAFLLPRTAVRRRLPAVVAVGTGMTMLAALPTLASALTFARVSSGTLGSGSTVSSTLGQLQRPLEPIQAAGIWLSEDYGLPLRHPALEPATYLLSGLVLLLVIAAVITFLRRRETGPLLPLLATAVTAAVVAPGASPYADAKLLALASPAIVFAALCAALAWHGRLRTPGAVLACFVCVGAFASAAFAYHGVRIAPTQRLQALEDVVDRVANDGWILLDEVEEFGKYYGRAAPHFNVGFEALTPRQARPFGGGYHVDLDQLEQPYVQSFDAIVTRIGPATSRPPANYRRVYGNRFYEAWRKRPGVRVKAHLPVQDALRRGDFVPCRQIRDFTEGAGTADRLVASTTPEMAQLPVVGAPDRPLGWPPLAAPPGVVEPRSPGSVERSLTLDGGTYDAWVRASTGRRIYAGVDGRRIGSVKGINSQGQWLQAGTVSLDRGRHELRLERPGGNLTPGDGAASVLGPLALVHRERRRLREVAPRQWRELCGERWDWIEVVAR